MDIKNNYYSTNQYAKFDQNKLKANNAKAFHPSFKGSKITQDNKGDKYYEIYLPYNQESKDNIQLEILTNKKQFAADKNSTRVSIAPTERRGGSLVWKVPLKDLNTDPNSKYADTKIAYRFRKVVDGKNDQFVFDPASGMNTRGPYYGNDYFIKGINPNGGALNRNRTTYELMPQSFNPKNLKKDERGFYPIRNHVDNFGGTLNDVTDKLDYIKGLGFTDIKTTPIQGGDEISNHGYWGTNQQQVPQSLGGEKAYNKLVKESLKRNMALIDDSASVNEAMEGIHIQSLHRYGADSPFKDWFTTYNFPDKTIKWGCLPPDTVNGKQSEAYKHFDLQLVNAPQMFKDGKLVENKAYDKKLPSYVQLYDTRLTSKEQLDDLAKGNLIRRYDKFIKNPNEITNYKDSVQPLAFQITHEEAAEKIKNFKTGINPKDHLLNWDHFSLAKANESGGISLWDGNKDIALLNFDNPQVVDYTYKTIYDRADKVGKLQTEYIASQIGDSIGKETDSQTIFNKIKELATTADSADTKINPQTGKPFATKLPDSILKLANKNELTADQIKNIMNGSFNKESLKYGRTPSNMLDSLMSYNLDRIEFPREICSITSSPLVSKLADKEELVGVSRYQMLSKPDYKTLNENYKAMDNVYKNKMQPLVEKIIDSNPNLKQKLYGNGTELSESGKKVFNLVSDDVVKYLTVKSIAKVDPTNLKSAKALEYDIPELQKNTFKNIKLDVLGKDSNIAAKNFIQSLSDGLDDLSKDDKSIKSFGNYLEKRTANINSNVIDMAHMLLNKTELGIGFRIDAAKNVANIDNVDRGLAPVYKAQQKMESIFGKIFGDISKDYPKTYSIIELTGPGDLHKINGTTKTNFNPSMNKAAHGGADLENDYHIGMQDAVNQMLDDKLNYGDHNEITYSHEPVGGNPDKARAAHNFSLDNKAFFEGNRGDVMKGALDGASKNATINEVDANKLFKELTEKNKDLKTSPEKIKSFLSESHEDLNKNSIIQQLLYNGSSDLNKGEIANQFAARPFEQNWKMMSENAVTNADNLLKGWDAEDVKTIKAMLTSKELENGVHKDFIQGALGKYRSMLKWQTVLPGNPTMNAGDEFGLTGFETPGKNVYLQNRNVVPFDYIEKNSGNYKDFIAKHNDECQEIINLRKDPKLSPLGNGDTIKLNLDVAKGERDNLAAIYRYNDERDVVAILNNAGLSNIKEASIITPQEVSRIQLSDTASAKGLQQSSIKDGTIFVNAQNPGEKFVVKTMSDGKYNHSYLTPQNGGNINVDDAILVLRREHSFKTEEKLKNLAAFKQSHPEVLSDIKAKGQDHDYVKVAKSYYTDKLNNMKKMEETYTNELKKWKAPEANNNEVKRRVSSKEIAKYEAKLNKINELQGFVGRLDSGKIQDGDLNRILSKNVKNLTSTKMGEIPTIKNGMITEHPLIDEISNNLKLDNKNIIKTNNGLEPKTKQVSLINDTIKLIKQNKKAVMGAAALVGMGFIANKLYQNKKAHDMSVNK